MSQVVTVNHQGVAAQGNHVQTVVASTPENGVSVSVSNQSPYVYSAAALNGLYFSPGYVAEGYVA